MYITKLKIIIFETSHHTCLISYIYITVVIINST